jgi:NitT/TauT family transport system substrate-binding protein
MSGLDRRSVLRGALAAPLFLGAGPAARAQSLTPIKLRLDWVWQSPQSVWSLANARGYFRDEGLSVTIDRGYGGLENAQAIAGGNYDFLFGDMNTVMLFNAKSPERKLLSVFVIYDVFPGTIITRKDSGIARPKELEGRTIVAPLTTGGRTMFPAFARANGVDESKVIWQTVSIQLQAEQFAKRQADALAGYVTTSIPDLEQLGVRRDELSVMNFADYGVDLYGSGVVVRADLAERNPDLVRKFLRVTVRGLKAIIADKVAAVESLKKHDPLLNTAIEVGRLELMIDLALKRPNVEQNGVSHVDAVRLQRNIDTLTEVFKLPDKQRPEDVYTDKFLPPAAERMLSL